MAVALWSFAFCCAAVAHAAIPQISIPLVERMPNFPSPWIPVDWAALARNQTAFVFNLASSGEYTPLLWWDDSHANFPQRTFGVPSYVGAVTTGTAHEAIAGAALVLSGWLTGTNMSCAGTSCVDLERMLLNYYDVSDGSFVWKDTTTGSPTAEFWYQAWMSMLPLMVLHARTPYVAPWSPAASAASASAPPPDLGPLAPYVLNATLNWAAAVASLKGDDPLPDFNFTGVNFSTGGGPPVGYLDAHTMTQPVASAGLGWLQYTARAAAGLGCTGACAEMTLQAAHWSLDYLTTRIPYDPFWEVLLPFGATAAARMNAELRGSSSLLSAGAEIAAAPPREYDVGRLLGWILQDDETPPVSPFRWGWGTICDAWGGVDVHGLIGSVTDRDGYAFNMDSVAVLTAALPVARYNASFARALGKWAHSAINAARLFFPQFNTPEQQTNWAWVTSTGSPVGYEGLRKWGFNDTDDNITGPYATGDGMAQDELPTNIAPYGSAYVGLLGAVVRRSSSQTIVGTDLLPVDYHHGPAWPTTLYFNPAIGPEQAAVTLPSGAGCDTTLCSVYDAVAQVVVASTSAPGQITVNVTFASDAAAVLVVYPSAAPLAYDPVRGWLTAGGAVIDWAATGLPPL